MLKRNVEVVELFLCLRFALRALHRVVVNLFQYIKFSKFLQPREVFLYVNVLRPLQSLRKLGLLRVKIYILSLFTLVRHVHL